MVMSKKRWLQKAIKRPGAATEWCKRRGYSGATCECLRKMLRIGEQRNDRTLIGRATLGMRLKGCSGVKGKIAKKRKRSKKK